MNRRRAPLNVRVTHSVCTGISCWKFWTLQAALVGVATGGHGYVRDKLCSTLSASVDSGCRQLVEVFLRHRQVRGWCENSLLATVPRIAYWR